MPDAPGEGRTDKATAAGPPPAQAPREDASPRAPTPWATAVWQALQNALKWGGYVLGLGLAALPGLICRCEGWLSRRQDLFLFFGQGLALLPGLPGKYLRKCFYYWTLESGSLTCDIGFLSFFSSREARVGERVYVGVGVSLGKVTLGEGALIGNRVSVLSGGHQHRFGPDGRLTPFDYAAAPRITIGEETWVGEGAVLMADLGSRCIVAAGSVVSRPLPDGCMVGGNPARFIGKTIPDEGEASPTTTTGPQP